ncbi:GNAT family N-acetyltransferase [Microbacterium sp. SORGH_AS_0862]|uniref:GNAT family N-acetyltransferase n=1 Tax=Microbacterium sp. SORGH_AS_0862 TaxID=3041789 RepID=UPI00278F204D|nr:GNAT family N-acetyltransferase [Microbacterium sp. SORGH_AS_0862]MDQ1206125.1 putative acetyltransferase [Microbacterium sp. SORGH_AS_0862]
MTMLDYRVDDPTRGPAHDLVTSHLAAMHAGTPAESVHALDATGLSSTDVTFWSAWSDGELAGIGALKRWGDDRGELKSMRVADAFRGTGVGRGILRHILGEAAAMGLTSVWLETGSTPEFVPAARLYESEGFIRCGPFADYRDDPLSLYFTRAI